MMPLTVTFDTNTLASVVSPDAAQRDTGTSGAVVRAAIQAGRIQGFFSETLITLEGIGHEDRSKVLGKTQVVTETTSPSKNTINITVGVRHFRTEPDSRFSARVEGAIALGMRVLEVVSTMGVGSPLLRR